MTAFRVFSSTDSSAPVLTGQAGSLVNLLDAVLVDGYGAGPSAKAPAGWTREFSDTNKRVYRNDPVSGTGYRVRIDDTASVGNARYAWARAYESMSDIDTGANPVPTVAQRANGSMWVKSSALSSAARPWVIVANDKTAYCFFDAAPLGIADSAVFWFGDIRSNRPGDGHAFFMSVPQPTSFDGSPNSTPYTQFDGPGLSSTLSAFDDAAATGVLARAYGGAVGAVMAAPTRSDMVSGGRHGGGGIAYPDPVSGGLLFSPVHIREPAPYTVRGRAAGLYCPQHARPLTDGSTLLVATDEGAVTVYAKSFKSTYQASNASYNCQVLIDLTTEY